MDNERIGKETVKIIIEGIVQGVGFRPFVYRAASALGIQGYVANVGGAVEIYAVCDSGMQLAALLRVLRDNPPTGAVIVSVEVSYLPATTDYSDFRIIGGVAENSAARFVSPDISICDDCAKEVLSNDSRRRHHFFSSCASCGARYTIISQLPYDRANTTMAGFGLCETCAGEYENPADRRFHAETICCNDCGVDLQWRNHSGESADGGEAFNKAAERLRAGGVIAVKGIGGYHLACSPFDDAATGALRRLKRRDAKPLAVMFRDMDEAGKYCHIDDDEATLLNSPQRPITLLRAIVGLFATNVLNNDSRCGAFLPYTPLHLLLTREIPALVLTSANASNAAIITEDGAMLSFMRENPLLCGVLYNDRVILRSAEDSVAHISRGKPQVLRRSRGYAPLPIKTPLKISGGGAVFAAGGDLKSAFCLAKGGYIFQSPYFGDLIDEDVYSGYSKAVYDLSSLLDIQPKIIARDSHPAYVSSAFAEALAGQRKARLIDIQHHHAHAASVMAEHGINRAVAVCFDGTGYGEDGAVWGGEFLIAERGGFLRAGHLGYVELIGGDSAAKYADKTALCYLINGGVSIESDKTLAAAIKNRINTAAYSSMGRLFDAVAAVLGLCNVNEYEGQCAIAVLQAAEAELSGGDSPIHLDFDIDCVDGMFVPNQMKLLRDIFYERQSGAGAGALALGFHHAVSRMVGKLCREIAADCGVTDIALTGGVFQNVLLTELCEKYIGEQSKNLKIHTNALYPPNDNGLAVGQAWIAMGEA